MKTIGEEFPPGTRETGFIAMPEIHFNDPENTSGLRRLTRRPNDPVTVIRYRKFVAIWLAAILTFAGGVLLTVDEGTSSVAGDAGLCASVGALFVGMCALLLDGQATAVEMRMQDRKAIEDLRADLMRLRMDFAGAEGNLTRKVDAVMRMETAMVERLARDDLAQRRNGIKA